MILSRFGVILSQCLSGEGRKKEGRILILRSASASSSHLKIGVIKAGAPK